MRIILRSKSQATCSSNTVVRKYSSSIQFPCDYGQLICEAFHSSDVKKKKCSSSCFTLDTLNNHISLKKKSTIPYLTFTKNSNLSQIEQIWNSNRENLKLKHYGVKDFLQPFFRPIAVWLHINSNGKVQKVVMLRSYYYAIKSESVGVITMHQFCWLTGDVLTSAVSGWLLLPPL